MEAPAAVSARQVLLACASVCIFSPATLLLAQSFPVPIAPPDADKTSSDSAVKAPEFDVASVKEDKSEDGRSKYMATPDGITMTNVPLKVMIAEAYGINQEFISGGPGWIDSTGYDLTAKVAAEDVPKLKQLTQAERWAMVQPLLEERFKLKVRVQRKIVPVYELRVIKSGTKLTPSAPGSPNAAKAEAPGAPSRGRMFMGPGHFIGHAVGMNILVANLAYVVHRPIVDKTGLTSTYDFDVKYAPEDEHGGAKPDDGISDQLPSIFTAFEEQLGLKLQSAKGPVKTLVIDQAEKAAEN